MRPGAHVSVVCVSVFVRMVQSSHNWCKSQAGRTRVRRITLQRGRTSERKKLLNNVIRENGPIRASGRAPQALRVGRNIIFFSVRPTEWSRSCGNNRSDATLVRSQRQPNGVYDIELARTPAQPNRMGSRCFGVPACIAAKSDIDVCRPTESGRATHMHTLVRNIAFRVRASVCMRVCVCVL